MIGLRGSSVALYKVGDQIQNGVRLHAVYPDRVLLEINGTIQTLGRTGNAGIAMPSPPSRALSNTAMFGFPGQQVEVSAPGLLRDALQYSELHVSGQLRAIQVTPGRDVQALQQLGLRPGDLIIAVNGTPIEEHPSGERALELLGNSSGGQVTIVRNGSRHDLAIHHAGVPRAPLE
jgi:general secretion pathway protein C